MNTTDQSLASLALRGQALASNPARIDMELFADAMENHYHETDNPEGAFALNMAENNIMGQRMREKLDELLAQSKLPQWVMQYTELAGHPEVRESVANFMQRHFGSKAITAENILFSAGASASLEVASFVLANPGDVVVIPAPAYPMYTNDLGVKSEMERYDLQTHDAVHGLASLALVTVEHLERALAELTAQHKVFKLLMITSPDNPTGSIYSEAQLRQIANWCMDHKIHLMVNEIYALSQINTEHPDIASDYVDPPAYVSFSNMMAEYNSEYLHMIYALSKDFAISGLRFGIIHSLNESFMTGLGGANIPHMVSNLTQWLLGELFKDEKFVVDYVAENQKRLTANYLIMVKALRGMDVPYTPSRGSLFIWADFSKFLRENTAEAEMRFWQDIYEATGVLLTPGVGFQHLQHGLYRVVYTVVEPEALTIAMGRLSKFIKERTAQIH